MREYDDEPVEYGHFWFWGLFEMVGNKLTWFTSINTFFHFFVAMFGYLLYFGHLDGGSTNKPMHEFCWRGIGTELATNKA